MNLKTTFESPAAAEARRVIDELANAGFMAYFAGGCVRDALLKRKPKDFDVATNATPESVREVFGKKRTLAFGASFGVIGVLPKSKERRTPGETLPTEVATFRSDGQYSDGRRPDSVVFGSAQEDAQRRDFTINGMFYDPIAAKVIDYVEGQNDLQSRVLRTIGIAAERFDEDKLRMLRAVRFATTLGFRIADTTRDAVRRFAADIQVVSGERIGAEMRRVLLGSFASDGLRKLVDCGLADTILPELQADRLDQVCNHIDRLPVHCIELCLAAVLFDRQDASSSLSAITNRWKLSNEEIRRIEACLRDHDTITNARDIPWSQVQPVLISRDASIATDFAHSVVALRCGDPKGISIARQALQWPIDRLNPAPLLTGDHLRDLGFQAGPVFKTILARVRADQLDGKIESQEQAIEIAKNLVAENP